MEGFVRHKKLAPYKIDRLIENRTCFGGQDSQLSLYETFVPAKNVDFHNTSLLCGVLLNGKKRISIKDGDHFEFTPNEMVVIPPNSYSDIEFTDTTLQSPTVCLTVEISDHKVQAVIDKANETRPREDGHTRQWQPGSLDFAHFDLNRELKHSLNNLAFLFTDNSPYKDHLIDINTSELIVRLLQTNSRKLLMERCHMHTTSSGLAKAIQFIKDNLSSTITIDQLAQTACMSKPTFYRYFRNEFGITPLQFINSERLELASKMLADRNSSVTDVCFSLGFNNLSHFSRLFKREKGLCPVQYKALHLGSTQ